MKSKEADGAGGTGNATFDNADCQAIKPPTPDSTISRSPPDFISSSLPTHPSSLLRIRTMSYPELSSFNPLAAHPFTAGGSPRETSPIQTPTPPEDSLLFSSMPWSMSSSPSVSPLEVPGRPTYCAPQTFAPKPIPSYVPQGVFERYDRGRITPDLVIRKNLNNWGAQQTFR